VRSGGCHRYCALFPRSRERSEHSGTLFVSVICLKFPEAAPQERSRIWLLLTGRDCGLDVPELDWFEKDSEISDMSAEQTDQN
jgi:hypothetical protein